jgi:uncharacterized protein
MMRMKKKLERLKNHIERMERLAIAFSGGTDSAFLLKVARDVLKSNVMAITVKSAIIPQREFDRAIQLAQVIGADLRIILFEETDIENFSHNPADRCYHCKKALFGKMMDVARDEEFRVVADGSNIDDLDDTRPGMKALRELGIPSPLIETQLTKDEIRELSRQMGLSSWDRPSSACLASRIPLGQTITKEKLRMIDQAEQFLQDLGFRQVRVRHHGDTARIEVPQDELAKFMIGDLAARVAAKLKAAGFVYTALDLQGYRTGSLNETPSRLR